MTKANTMPTATGAGEELNCYVPNSRELKATGPGHLSGRSFVAKDLFMIRGHVSSFGHARWRETHQPGTETAPLITRLLDAGAHLRGLTKLDQLAYSLIGNVGEGPAPVNPHAPDRFTGGSSSGSASAVAGGLADIGLGTDTAGSIRVPAAACGLYSLRPTHGSIDTRGVLPLAQSFDVPGAFARSATILKDAMAVLGAPNEGRSFREVLVPTPESLPCEPAMIAAARRAGQLVADRLGATLSTTTVDEFCSAPIADLFARLQGREIWNNHHQWVSENIQHLADDVRVRLDRCKQWSTDSADIKRADEGTRREYTKQLESLVGRDGLLVLPAAPGLHPLRHSTLDEQKAFRVKAVRLMAPSSFTGMPEAVLPVAGAREGTLGVGLVSRRNSDMALLSAIAEITEGREVLLA